MKLFIILALGVTAVAAIPYDSQRIVGGSVTTIGQYPYAAALIRISWQACGGTIINNRSVLTATHCFLSFPAAASWRVRVGSTNANSGGALHNTLNFIHHPAFNRATMDSDVSILRVATNFVYGTNVRAAGIAGPNYNLPDNAPVWAIGWGSTFSGGPLSEQLRHVQVWVVNQTICRNRYAELRHLITDNMLCSGWLDVGGRDQCQGDSGGPLIHINAIVGVCSWGEGCALPRFPGVNARVSRFTSWIQVNA